MTKNNYIILSSDSNGIIAEDYSKEEIDDLLSWDEECNGIKMKSELGCTSFTDDVYDIGGETCLLIKGEIVVPEQRERELVITRNIQEYAL